MLCLDEADELLSESFREPIQAITGHLPNSVQALIFSAEIPEEVSGINLPPDPVKILTTAALTLERIRQFYVETERGAKMQKVIEICERLPTQKVVIFANSSASVNEVEKGLRERGFAVSAAAGLILTGDRHLTIESFMRRSSRIVVARDHFAMGINRTDVAFVINFDVPKDYDNYLRRIGRTAKHRRNVVAINLCDSAEMEILQRVKSEYQLSIDELPADYAEVAKAVTGELNTEGK
jgi:superfamily II DNA/RNA helicase